MRTIRTNYLLAAAGIPTLLLALGALFTRSASGVSTIGYVLLGLGFVGAVGMGVALGLKIRGRG
ncbi:hypothetical protein GCM10009759_42770 [Kitasatospora saccharophila]|uniref:Secreted protein with PEP-CTERM sorting signal n=1 Tax=Kitasatospora saccharophila TaxID=407973 RepID=A0ABN2X8Q0_9ACTN